MAHKRRRFSELHTFQVVLIEVGNNLLLRQGAIIDYAVAQRQHVAQRFGDSLMGKGTQLLIAHDGCLNIVGTVVHICAQTLEITLLVGLGVGTRFHGSFDEGCHGLRVGNSLRDELFKQRHSLGHVLAEAADHDVGTLGGNAHKIFTCQRIECLLHLCRGHILGSHQVDILCRIWQYAVGPAAGLVNESKVEQLVIRIVGIKQLRAVGEGG